MEPRPLFDRGPLFERVVHRPVTGAELLAGVGIALAAVGIAVGLGGSASSVALAAVAGLVLGHLPAMRPGGARVRLVLEDRELVWRLLAGEQLLDEERIALLDVIDGVVMPDEGAGWGLELRVRSGRRERLWAPRLPLGSAADAEQLLGWILDRAGSRGAALERVDEARARPW